MMTCNPVFRQADRLEKAMIAHEKALDWQELCELAVQQALSNEELKDTAYRVSGTFRIPHGCVVDAHNYTEDLVAKKRTLEAANVLLDYAKDVRAAVIALVEGSHFSEARRIVSRILSEYVPGFDTTYRLFCIITRS